MKEARVIATVALMGSLTVMACPVLAGQHAAINWEIANTFRAFDYLGANNEYDPKEAIRAFETYRIHPEDESMENWYARLVREGVESPYKEKDGPWIEKDSTGGGTYRKDFLELPKEMTIKAKLASPPADSSVECSWMMNRRVRKEARCSEEVSITADSSGGELSVKINNQPGPSVSVKPKLRIIVGIGDSYGSGQGNPDRPTKWGISKRKWLDLSHDAVDAMIDTPSRWWSNRCDRSFWSYQNFVALAAASADRHNIVAFIHLSCSGAEIVDGLLSPQRMAPGHPKNLCKKRMERPESVYRECDVGRSQMRALTDLLCARSTHPMTSKELARYKEPLIGLAHDPNGARRINELTVCPSSAVRPVETVLLSIGGNDMGFGSVIAWGLMPYKSKDIPFIRYVANQLINKFGQKAGVICPKPDKDKRCQGATAIRRIEDLPKRYESLQRALNDLFEKKVPPVIITQYPNPLYDVKGDFCGNEPYKNLPNEWYGTRMIIPIRGFVRHRMQINLTEWEAAQVNESIIPLLNAQVKAAALKHKWTPINQDTLMSGRGWCTGDHLQLMPPTLAANWKPYAPNTRRIRNGNDSFLTQWPGDNREDGVSGTFHPTADAHAGMADLVMKVLNLKFASAN